MAELLVVGSYGMEDMTRATLAFLTAKAAKENKDDPTLFLVGDAVIWAKKGMAESELLQGVGLAPFAEVFEICQILKIPILVCKPCAEIRGIKEADLAEGTKLSGIYDLAKLVASRHTISF
jgi:predicted peroxiredoxin